MESAKPITVLTVGSEKIYIEQNDLYSDDSDMSDSSSCLSYSGFEEIEIRQSLNAEKQRKEEAFPNPYVKLVRCDHLVKKALSSPTLKQIDHIATRSSSRMRCPKRVYVPDEVLVNYKRKRKSSKRMKKKQKSISKDVKIVRNKRDKTFISKRNKAFRTDLAQNIKQEYFNESEFEHASGMTCDKRSISDTIEELPILSIKQEPRDDYFDGMHGNSFSSNNFRTSSCKEPLHSNPLQFPKIQINTIINREDDLVNGVDYYMNYKPMVNEDLPRMNTGYVIRENIKGDSSDSEVDVEKDWEGPLFTPDHVSFDHSYSCQTEEVSNIAPVNKDIVTNGNTNLKPKKTKMPKEIQIKETVQIKRLRDVSRKFLFIHFIIII